MSVCCTGGLIVIIVMIIMITIIISIITIIITLIVIIVILIAFGAVKSESRGSKLGSRSLMII